jgi:hypothetical protein
LAVQLSRVNTNAPLLFPWGRGNKRVIWRVELKGPALDRTELLTAASNKLSEAVILLTAAGEERLAASAEDLVQQVELTALEGKMPPNSTTH